MAGRPKKTEAQNGATDVDIFDSFEKKYGKGSFIKASDLFKPVDVISTGSLSLDRATGVGGFPKGRFTMITGDEGSSKTTLALHTIAECQKKGGKAAFLDVEASLDMFYATNIGVDTESMFVVDPTHLNLKEEDDLSGELWFNMLGDVIDSNQFDVIVLDSLAALTPKSEFAGVDTAGIGKLSRMISQGFRYINSKLSKTKNPPVVIILNQFRTNIGAYGDPRIESGGQAAKYYPSLMLRISKSNDKDNDGIHGITVKVKITKNKVGKPYQESEYYVRFGEGIIPWYEIMTAALEEYIITKEGNTYLYNGTKIAVGLKQLEEFFETNEEFTEQLKIILTEKWETESV